VPKKEIIQAVAVDLELSVREIKPIVDKTFAAIVDMLVKEGRVELRNFGVFAIRWRKARKARNPRSGERVMVPERCTVVFKPGRMVEETVDRECRIAAVDGEGRRQRPVTGAKKR
jgi:nucleoid DNA-binding protein